MTLTRTLRNPIASRASRPNTNTPPTADLTLPLLLLARPSIRFTSIFICGPGLTPSRLCQSMIYPSNRPRGKESVLSHLPIVTLITARNEQNLAFQEESAPARGSDWLLCYTLAYRVLPTSPQAPIKTTMSFRNLEAALPPGILQAADPVARKVLFIPELASLVQFRGALDGPHGGIVRFGCNLSPIGRGLYFAYVRGHEVKRAPNIAISP